jgi:hypothetical protein
MAFKAAKKKVEKKPESATKSKKAAGPVELCSVTCEPRSAVGIAAVCGKLRVSVGKVAQNIEFDSSKPIKVTVTQ